MDNRQPARCEDDCADCVEAELVHDGSGPRPEGPWQAPPPGGPSARPAGPPPGPLARLRGLLAGALVIISAGLIILGALLTATIIGALIGVPLIALGAAGLWLFFRFFASSLLGGRVVVGKFP